MWKGSSRGPALFLVRSERLREGVEGRCSPLLTRIITRRRVRRRPENLGDLNLPVDCLIDQQVCAQEIREKSYCRPRQRHGCVLFDDLLLGAAHVVIWPKISFRSTTVLSKRKLFAYRDAKSSVRRYSGCLDSGGEGCHCRVFLDIKSRRAHSPRE